MNGYSLGVEVWSAGTVQEHMMGLNAYGKAWPGYHGGFWLWFYDNKHRPAMNLGIFISECDELRHATMLEF